MHQVIPWMDAHAGFVTGIAGLLEAGALVMLWFLERSTLRIEKQREADSVRLDVLVRLHTRPAALEFCNLCSVPVLLDSMQVFIRDQDGLSDPFRAESLGFVIREYSVLKTDITHWVKKAAEIADKGPILEWPHNVEVKVRFFAHHSWHVVPSENGVLVIL